MNLYLYLYQVKTKKENITINGLSERHVAQIIRRSMIQKSVPSKKNYKRAKFKYNDNN